MEEYIKNLLEDIQETLEYAEQNLLFKDPTGIQLLELKVKYAKELSEIVGEQIPPDNVIVR